MPSHPDRVRRHYPMVELIHESGWCSHCGPYSGLGEHVCPDGTKPQRISLSQAPQALKDLYEDGKNGD